jgi:hypothetical protein
MDEIHIMTFLLILLLTKLFTLQLGLLWEIKHFILMDLGTELPVLFHSDCTQGGVGALPYYFLAFY